LLNKYLKNYKIKEDFDGKVGWQLQRLHHLKTLENKTTCKINGQNETRKKIPKPKINKDRKR